MDGGSESRSRLYDLSVGPIADARVRYAVAASVARRLPPSDATPLVQALAGAGLTARLALHDAAAALLLRELYATGVPPAAVALRPIGLPSAAPPGHDRDARRLAVFAERGGRFALSWNWSAFVFGPLWYYRKGLYAKGTLLLVLSVLPIWTLPVTLLVSFAIVLYCGLAGDWDHYLWRAKRTQWWG